MFISPLETLEVAGHRSELHAFEVAPGTVEGDGLNLLSHVDLNDLIPTRVQLAGGVQVQRTWFMPRHSGSLVLLYDLDTQQDATLTLGALLTHRDMHHVCTQTPRLEFLPGGLEMSVVGEGVDAHSTSLRLYPPEASRIQALVPRPVPQRVHFRLDTARGAPDTERAVRTDVWALHLPPGRHRLALVVGDPGSVGNPWNAYAEEIERRRLLILRAFSVCGVQDSVTATLAVSADSFLVYRQSTQAVSVIAGYPWFADWGRDSMIALTGLTLLTGRLDDARALLSTYLGSLRRGLTPNNFHDDGSGADYNTVDGALWLITALERYVRLSGDREFAQTHLETVRGIIRAHLEGTDHGIRADPQDGLLLAGETGVQLTWMDVKIHDWVVTPRHGKPVEIQALWLAALSVESRMSEALGQPPAFAALLLRARPAFLQLWNPDDQYFYDVLAADGTPDASVRPNVLLALALPDTPAVPAQLDAALLTAGRELLTPLGLRTLALSDPRYLGNYGGSQLVRDAAYHQGTVWPWPLAAYTDLLLKRGRVADARAALDGLEAHLWDAGLGSVSEVFSGSTLLPGGCPFQAWSVAELLRAHVAVAQAEKGRGDAAREERG
ncbi:amylo-alpha-1,6-glucosidase [Deinococcus sp. KNUC1210]|uniref:amylo-alpha-1,6-glucosidase n=1 Tax=Deinococcus sp. KNUC1210 TaxID=2917691 RepID=UPI002105AA4B|nr:amylo-alpha-1,6-glucosidase [Deinococcus sp. KNUC1210]